MVFVDFIIFFDGASLNALKEIGYAISAVKVLNASGIDELTNLSENSS